MAGLPWGAKTSIVRPKGNKQPLPLAAEQAAPSRVAPAAPGSLTESGGGVAEENAAEAGGGELAEQ
eukprot:11178634-Lingulodinium_polyedra.AAC.1